MYAMHTDDSLLTCPRFLSCSFVFCVWTLHTPYPHVSFRVYRTEAEFFIHAFNKSTTSPFFIRHISCYNSIFVLLLLLSSCLSVKIKLANHHGQHKKASLSQSRSFPIHIQAMAPFLAAYGDVYHRTPTIGVDVHSNEHPLPPPPWILLPNSPPDFTPPDNQRCDDRAHSIFMA